MRSVLEISEITGSGSGVVGGGGGWVFISNHTQVTFPCIHDSRYFLEPKVSSGTIYRRSILKHADS